ncbi:FKBP-type peptidyl-prolyl cis-trans isomerase [Candidatus Saccharibacteria bacterium]|nr:FKBP-type peptidyl-prolyl cis-trans isomerase [Candidatus Saccharibacteria bacterium]
MQKQTIVLSTVALFALVVLSIGGYFIVNRFSKSNDAIADTKPAVDLPLSSAQARSSTPKQTNQEVQSAVTTPSQQNTSLPKPDQFSQYEKYEEASSTQFIDTKQGTGTEAVRGSSVWMLYKGWLTNGSLFDETRTNEQGQLVAFNFTLGSGQVIQGWEDGIVGMKEGGKRRLIIPSQFGYGQTGQSGIPPNAMLIFDVELVKVQN